MSRSKWILGVHSPLSDKVSIHAIDWGDARSLFALIGRLRDRAEAKFGFPAVSALLLRGRI